MIRTGTAIVFVSAFVLWGCERGASSDESSPPPTSMAEEEGAPESADSPEQPEGAAAESPINPAQEIRPAETLRDPVSREAIEAAARETTMLRVIEHGNLFDDLDGLAESVAVHSAGADQAAAESLRVADNALAIADQALNVAGTGGGSLTLESPHASPPIVINAAGDFGVRDCANAAVVINASGATGRFTGACGTVTVNGTSNNLHFDDALVLTVNGSANEIARPSGVPARDNGVGNRLTTH